MAQWNMNKFVVFAAGIALGTAVAGPAAYMYGSRYALWGAYMDAANSAHKNIAVLRNLRADENEKARVNLEQFLELDEAVLRGCKYDLCSTDAYPRIRDALQEIEEYRASN